MEYMDLLHNTESFRTRNEDSLKKISRIREAFATVIETTRYDWVSVFCGGSLGRGDVGTESDLDLFILANKTSTEISKIDTLELLSKVININKSLGYRGFSNDGQYLNVYSFPDLLRVLGSRNDDVYNLFTVRMLLLLESRPIYNDHLYGEQINQAIGHYFRDSSGKALYKPMFLINDILRYWRTVCLNYELVRNDTEKPWRKKNINLKFSRMLTVFGSVLPLIAAPTSSKTCMHELVKLTPMERLARGLDYLGDASVEDKYLNFLDAYERFLKLKEQMGSTTGLNNSSVDKDAKEHAKVFSWFLHECLTHEKINKEYRKYLIL